MVILYLWHKDIFRPWGEALVAGFIPDSPSQNCLSAAVLNGRIGKQVTWLGMTASSTTPADNVFLHLWLFHIFIENVHSTFVRSVSLTSRSQRKVCHHLSLSSAIREARQKHVSPPPEGRFDIDLHLHGTNIEIYCCSWFALCVKIDA